jgi:hypothetical protein
VVTKTVRLIINTLILDLVDTTRCNIDAHTIRSLVNDLTSDL